MSGYRAPIVSICQESPLLPLSNSAALPAAAICPAPWRPTSRCSTRFATAFPMSIARRFPGTPPSGRGMSGGRAISTTPAWSRRARVPAESRLERPVRNADIDALAAELAVRQVKTLASGIDAIMAELREAVARPSAGMERHTHAVVFLYEYPRDPSKAEPGGEWIAGTNAQRAALRAAETAAVLANYFRLLGYPALAHTATTTDVNLNVLAVASGLTTVVEDDAGTRIENPFVGRHFGMAAITTTMALAPDRPLAPGAAAAGLRWRMGFGTVKRRGTARPYAKRRFVDGELPFEKIKRVKHPTTLIDEARIPARPETYRHVSPRAVRRLRPQDPEGIHRREDDGQERARMGAAPGARRLHPAAGRRCGARDRRQRQGPDRKRPQSESGAAFSGRGRRRA